MRKAFKPVIAVILALTLSFCIAAPAFAEQSCDCGNTPVIVISGMAAMPLYLNGEKVWSPSGNMIMKLVGKVLIPTICLLMDNDYDKFTTRIMPAAQEFFDPMACDDNGDSVHNVEYLEFPLSADNYTEYYDEDNGTNEMSVVHSYADAVGGDHVYFFNYDWRLDPLDHADALKIFIEKVKADTNHKEVSLVACSMGGTVMMSYLKKYTASGIKNCVLASTAFQGTAVVGEVFQRKIHVYADGLTLRINQLGKKGTAQLLYPMITEILNKTGIMDSVVDFVNKLMQAQLDDVYSEIIDETFGHMPGMWALVADDYYEDAKSIMLDPVKNAKLIERLDDYHYNVQAKAEDIISAAEALGCEVYIVSQYNMQGLPISEKSTSNNSDFLVDTIYGSGGAIAADYMKTLPSGYEQADNSCGHNHISADGVIDASTCMRPERTWFIKSMGHIDFPYESDAAALLIWLSSSDAENGCNVFTSAQYPQFTEFNANTNRLLIIN